MKKRLSLRIFAIFMSALLVFSGSALVAPSPVDAYPDKLSIDNVILTSEKNDLEQPYPPPKGEIDITIRTVIPGIPGILETYTYTEIIGDAPGMDEVRWWNDDFGWTHTFHPIPGKTITSAKLEIRSWDVDFAEGQRDIIYADGQHVGLLGGVHDTWSYTTFNIDPDLLKDGELNIFIDIDSVHTVRTWKVIIDWSKLTVMVCPVGLPVPHFTISMEDPAIENPIIYEMIRFDASLSYDPDGEIVSYRWNFGDGTCEKSGVIVSHRYQEAGTFIVRLTVEDNEGRIASKEMTLHVLDPAVPLIASVTPRVEGIALHGIQFENTFTAYVISETPISKVIFRHSGRTFPDTDGTDGWSAAFDVGILEGVSHLEVIAVDENGVESVPFIIEIQTIGLPDWLIWMMKVGWVVVSDCGTIEFEMRIPDPPVDTHISVPKWIPVFGGRHDFKASSEFFIEYRMPDGTAIVGGEGIVAFTIPFKKPIPAEGEIGVEGEVQILPNIRLQRVTVSAEVGATLLRKRWRVGIELPWWLRGGKKGVCIHGTLTPHVGLCGTIITDPYWRLRAEIEAGITAAGGVSKEILGATLSLGARGTVCGGIAVPAPHKPHIGASIYAYGAIRVWSRSVTIKIGPYEYRLGRAAMAVIPKEYIRIGEWELVEKYGRIPLYEVKPVQVAKAMVQEVAVLSHHGRLTVNNIEDEFPSVVYIGEGRFLVVWSAQCIYKDVQAGHDLFWSIYSIDTAAWTEIQMLTDDNYDDRTPALYKIGNEVTVVWSRVNRDFTDEYPVSPCELFPYIEIAYNTFSITHNIWSEPILLTENTELDLRPVVGDGFIAWNVDRDADFATTDDRLVKYFCIGTGATFEIPYASKPSLSGGAIAFFDTATEEIVFGRLVPELDIVSRFATTNFADLSLTYYDGSFTLVWADDLRMYYVNPEGTEGATLLETYSSVYTVDAMDFGNFELIAFTGRLPGDIRQRTSYKIGYDGVWIGERTLVDGHKLILWQADFAGGADGFFAVFAGKEKIEDKNDIFYVFHRFAGDLTISSPLTGNYSIGDSVTIDFTVENIGDQITPDFVVNLYNLDMKRISSMSFGSIAPGAKIDDSFTAILDYSGGFVLKVVSIPDLDLNNNKVSIRLIHPDLLVRDVSETRIKDELILTVSFENVEYVDAIDVGFKFSDGITTLYTGTLDIPANSIVDYTFAIDIKKISRNLTSGVMIDFENHILEENEENNILHFRVLMPDLSVNRGVIRAIRGVDDVLLRVLVKNQGIGDADAALTLLDQDLNPVKRIEFHIGGREEFPVYKEVQTILTHAEWDRVYLVSVDSKYGEIRIHDNIARVGQLLELPDVVFTHYPEVPSAGQSILFDASASSDPDGNIIQYIWNFGDGGSKVFTDVPTIEHTFLYAGVYTVSLTLVDNSGLTNEKTVDITVITTWLPDPAITSGLEDIGHDSTPTLFNMDGTWYLISGEWHGVFYGFRWTGTTWQSYPAIVSGLGDVGTLAAPTVFNMDGTWYLISGEADGVFNGFRWTGTTWQSDPAIASGLGDVGSQSTPTVFNMDGTWYLISGEYAGVFYGFKWTGTTWQSDPAIASGLGDVGLVSTPTVFNMDGTWYLISGESDGVFYGFKWTGTTWQSDPVIASGLGDVGSNSAPTVFNMDGTWYLISGNVDGVFYGFYGFTVLLKSITVTPDSATVNLNETHQFIATVLPEGADQSVTWSVDNAAVGTIDTTGLFTALAEGTVTVIATSVVDANITGTATVTVILLFPLPFDFILTARPSTAAVNQGEGAIATITATPEAGIIERVDFTYRLPVDVTGITVTLDPSSGEPFFTSTMTITTATDATPGTHAITIIGTSWPGGVVRTTPFTLTVEVVAPRIEHPIGLKQGWNLISLPLIPYDSRIEVVLAGILDDVIVVHHRYFDEAAGTWNWKSFPGALTHMVDGKGYWISMASSVTLIVLGTEMPIPPAMPPVISLFKGWNHIGFSSITSMTVDEYLGPTVIGTFEMMWTFDTATGDWIAIALGDLLQPGRGYWLAVSADGTIFLPKGVLE